MGIDAGRYTLAISSPDEFLSLQLSVAIRISRPYRSNGKMGPIATNGIGSCVVCRSVSLSVTIVSPAKPAEPIEMPYGFCIRWRSRSHGKGHFWADDVEIFPRCRAPFPVALTSGFPRMLSTSVQIGRQRKQLSFGSRPSVHYFRSVCWFVCRFVCLFVQSFSQPPLIRFRSKLDIWYRSGSSCVP